MLESHIQFFPSVKTQYGIQSVPRTNDTPDSPVRHCRLYTEKCAKVGESRAVEERYVFTCFANRLVPDGNTILSNQYTERRKARTTPRDVYTNDSHRLWSDDQIFGLPFFQLISFTMITQHHGITQCSCFAKLRSTKLCHISHVGPSARRCLAHYSNPSNSYKSFLCKAIITQINSPLKCLFFDVALLNLEVPLEVPLKPQKLQSGIITVFFVQIRTPQ